MSEPIYWARLRFEGHCDNWIAFDSRETRRAWVDGVRAAMLRASPSCAWSVAKMKRGPKS